MQRVLRACVPLVTVVTAFVAVGCLGILPGTLPTPTPSPILDPLVSGVRGIVLVGPTCPVQRLTSPCADRPAAVDLALYNAAWVGPDYGPPVVTFKSSDDGTFRVTVRPGDYILARAPCVDASTTCNQFPTITPQNVTVKPGAFTYVTVHGDTGIR